MPEDHDTKSDFENFHPISWCSCLGDPCMLSSQLLLHRLDDLFFDKFEFSELVCLRHKTYRFDKRTHSLCRDAWVFEWSLLFFCIHVVDDEIKSVKLHYIFPSSLWMAAIEKINYNEYRMGCKKVQCTSIVVTMGLSVHIRFFCSIL